MRNTRLIVLFLAVWLLSGCVAESKYRNLESKASAERAELEKDIAALRTQVAGQREEVARREAQISSLSEQTTGLESRKASLERQIAEMNLRLTDTEKRAAEATAQKDAEIARLKGTYDNLVKDLQGEISKGQIKVTQIRDKLSVQLVEKILFDSGKAEIKPEGKEVLSKVGKVLLGVTDKQIRIEGYTDSVPISAALRQRFPTNWELSTQRATTVLRYLETAGVDGKNLAAVGYGPFRPVASNDSLEGRAENRRIEIALTPLDVQEVLKELR
jgi:chemotaxis protein MotB